MKTNTIYACEKCGMVFENEKQCLEHEQRCGVKQIFTCDKCGTITEYESNSYYSEYVGLWNINLGRAGYGSSLDGCEIDFNLCDECLAELINSFTWEGKAKIHNSGSNTYGSNEEWIKYHKGEMTKEEALEYGAI